MHSRDMDSRFTEAAKLLDYGFELIEKEPSPQKEKAAAKIGR